MTGSEHKARRYALNVMKKLWGIPYKWGGDDPMEGVDCSGSIIEALKSVGVLPYSGDWTADGLFRLFRLVPHDEVNPGDLVFWVTDANKAIHIEMVYDVPMLLSIGASGGGSDTVSVTVASRRNAYVKIRPIYERGRSDKVLYSNPYKPQ